jgi:HSP20 family protein
VPPESAPATRHDPTRPVVPPRADIVETDDAVLLFLDMPGVTADSVEVMMQRELLTVRGTAQLAVPSNYAPHYREFTITDYERSFELGVQLERDLVSASMKDGVLRLEIPKSAAARKRRIPVAGGA